MNISDYTNCLHGSDSKTLFFTITNYGYLTLCLNMLRSLEKFQLQKSILIFCLDKKSYDIFKEYGYSCFLYDQQLAEMYIWGEKEFASVRFIKLILINKILGLGYSFIYTDNDIYFNQNILKNFEVWESREEEVFILNDSMDNDSIVVSPGFMYVKNTINTIFAFDYKQNFSNGQTWEDYSSYDQTYIDRFVKPKCKIFVLPLEFYPNGRYLLKYRFNDDMKVIHFNYAKGKNKIKKMRACYLWRITPNVCQKMVINNFLEYDIYDLDYVYGIGDFIRGSISLYNLCKKRGYDFEINYSNHIVSNYLTNKNSSQLPCDKEKIKNFSLWREENRKDLDKIDAYLATVNKRKIINVTTNLWNCKNIDKKCIDYIRNSLTPNEFLQSKINEQMELLNIEPKKYICIHIRMGDQKLLNNENVSEKYLAIQNKIHKITSQYENNFNVVVFSDDKDIKSFLNKNLNYKYMNTKGCHLGMKNKNPQDVIDTLIDFFILGGAHKIIVHSELAHGSGFSYWSATLHGVEIIKT